MAKKVNISMLDLKREYALLRKDIDKEIKGCFSSQAWILGPKVEQFEKMAASYLGARYALGVASGTDALVLSLKALALKLKKKEFFDKRDEIITTPLTFIATAEAIVRVGATPVFVDIDPRTFNISPERIKKAVTRNTVGIIPVHLYGLAADMNQIMKIARKHNLFVIEDTAQAFGAQYKGKKLGVFADYGAISFYPSKNLGAYGDGGLVVTNNIKLADFVRVLRSYGQRRTYDADYIGYNSRLDSIQAAVLLVKLKYIDKFNRLRREVAKKYSKALGGLDGICVPFEPKGSYHVYHLYTMKVFSRRDELLRYLNSKGIGARIYYPVPLNKMEAFKGAKVRGSLKGTKSVLSKILTLPIHPFLKDSETDYITKNILYFFNSKG